MSFADSLARLRTAVLGHRGMRPDKTVVQTRDLADLINHFDGLDWAMRKTAPTPSSPPNATETALRTALALLDNWDMCRSEMGGPNTIEGRTRAFLKEQGYVQR